MNVFVLAILIYLLYRFIAGFLIPVIRTTSHVRQQFRVQRLTPIRMVLIPAPQKWGNTLILRRSSEFKP
jgi:hypothetical protein